MVTSLFLNLFISVAGLTHKARRELHKAARRFMELSSRLLLQSLDGKKLRHTNSPTHQQQVTQCYATILLLIFLGLKGIIANISSAHTHTVVIQSLFFVKYVHREERKHLSLHTHILFWNVSQFVQLCVYCESEWKKSRSEIVFNPPVVLNSIHRLFLF